MDHFLYRNGILHAEDVAIPEIAARVGTPFYVYSTATLTRHFRLFTEALWKAASASSMWNRNPSCGRFPKSPPRLAPRPPSPCG